MQINKLNTKYEKIKNLNKNLLIFNWKNTNKTWFKAKKFKKIKKKNPENKQWWTNLILVNI